MLVHQYIIPRNERAGPLFQYRMHASWYRCSSLLRAETQWYSSTCYCGHYLYVSLFTNCESFNTSLHSILWETACEEMRTATVPFTHCEKLFVKQMRASAVQFRCYQCECVLSVLFVWVPLGSWSWKIRFSNLLERFHFPSRHSELSFIFQMKFSSGSYIIVLLCT